MRLELPKWYDLHAHFRQGDLLAPLVQEHLRMGCAGILAMPNTSPPVAKVFTADDLPYWSLEEYLGMLKEAGGDAFDDIIVPLYLTQDTTPDMIESGAESGVLRACKYYPPHGTTGAEFGADFDLFLENGVFAAMEEAGIVLCVHGEAHGLSPEEYISRETNAEDLFYKNQMPAAVKKFPNLKIVCEHVTTATAVGFVQQAPDMVAATVTPQHLLYTIGDLLQGLKYHLYCLPLLKFEEDREALRRVVTAPDNKKFFAGTDSAPHAEKITECGCAAGCYTGGIAPQLYAEAFELSGADVGGAAFKNFLCLNGPNFYGLDIPEETFILEKVEQEVKPLMIGSDSITPLPLGLNKNAKLPWCITT